MQESGQGGANENTVSTRVMELVVAGLFMALGALVMWDSWRLGAGWASDGPQAGYFPFYVALIMSIASAATFVTNLVGSTQDWSNFVDRSQLKLVLKVLVPTIVYVVLIGYLGIYVSSAIFIAFFMAWLGRYPIQKIVPVAVLVPLLLFMMFEVWFLVPLPKGPLEAGLGY
jgi:putative tricarboxylic transport membrane protein